MIVLAALMIFVACFAIFDIFLKGTSPGFMSLCEEFWLLL